MAAKSRNSTKNRRKGISTQSKQAGYLFVTGVMLFVIAMIAAQALYPCNGSGCYNIGTNPISDLGNTLTSPLWTLFNYSLIIFGAMFLAGIILLLKKLPKSLLGRMGTFFLVLSALGAMGVGTVPENTITPIHIIFAAIAFFAGGIGLLLTGIALSRKKGLTTYSGYTILSGIVVTFVFLIFTIPTGLLPHLNTSGSGYGFGAVERVIAGPLFIWIFVTGIKLLMKEK